LEQYFLFWVKSLIRAMKDSIDLVIAVSEYEKREAVRNYKFDPKKILVVPCPVDPQRFNPKVQRLLVRRKYRINKDDFVVLYVGKLNPTKRVDVLIKAIGINKKK